MADKEKYPLALRFGTVLAGRYIIEKVLGQGGFGITYKATDHKTSEYVAIKEYFPDGLAYREGSELFPYSGERKEYYDYGMENFLLEAKTLAEFIGNPNIVRVQSYFEENNTAYFVMDYVEGICLSDYIKEKGGRISFEEAKNILVPIIDALDAVHEKGIIHRDVTPDNIFIREGGKPVLIDFGAARYSLGDKSKSLDVILKHGFAPVEQYTRRSRQGPYTDIYTLGATFYYCLLGVRPPDSIERIVNDELVSLSSAGAVLPKGCEAAILKAMSVRAPDRYQTMGEFKKELEFASRAGIDKSKNLIEFTPPENKAPVTRNDPPKAAAEKPSSRKGLVIILSSVAAVLIIFVSVFIFLNNRKDDIIPTQGAPDESPVSDHSKSSSSEKSEPVATYTFKDNTLTILSDDFYSSDWKTFSEKTKRDVKTVVIKNGVTIIKESTFSEYDNLSEITISGSVKSIGDKSFSWCTNLKNVTVPDSVNSIGYGSFRGCKKLDNITIPDSVISIGKDAFDQTSWYNNQPEGMVYAGTVAYKYKGTIPENTSLELMSETKGIANYAFSDFTGLKKITIPIGVKHIGGRAFSGCTDLKNITIPNSVISIGVSAFSDCKNLTTITIPKSVTSIGKDSFSNCTNLKNIYGAAGSYAEKYAKDNKLPFVILKPLVNVSTISSEKIKNRESIKLYGKATDGCGEFTFSYLYKLSTKGTWNEISKGFVSDTVKELKLGKAGQYDIKIIAKDSTDAIAEKLFNVTAS